MVLLRFGQNRESVKNKKSNIGLHYVFDVCAIGFWLHESSLVVLKVVLPSKIFVPTSKLLSHCSHFIPFDIVVIVFLQQ